MEITRRYGVNVSTSVKGIKTYDCTVEITGGGEVDQKLISDIIIQESDALVAELNKRYPFIEEKK